MATLVCAVGVGQETKPQPATEPQYECRFQDGSRLIVTVGEATFTVKTRYGPLAIPLKSIRKLTVGVRVPDDLPLKIQHAMSELGSPDYQTREAASKTLIGIGQPAISALKQAANSDVPEVAQRSANILRVLKADSTTQPEDLRDGDAIETDDMTIHGNLDVSKFKARSRYFGNVTIRLSDLVEFRPYSKQPTTAPQTEPVPIPSPSPVRPLRR